MEGLLLPKSPSLSRFTRGDLSGSIGPYRSRALSQAAAPSPGRWCTRTTRLWSVKKC